jgi:tetratricopeptide (TPR) repeat protein
LVWLLCAASSSYAQHAPSVWERAAAPAREREERVYRRAEAHYIAAKLQRSAPMELEHLGIAMQVLEDGHAETANDVRLRFMFGEVARELHQYDRAARALESALREAPNYPAAAEAYFSLGICYAKLNRPEEEIVAYDEAIRRDTLERRRAITFMNRGDAQMLLGRLQGAISDYRASLRINPEEVLTHWSLAVALDRTGDAPGALNEAKIAITYDPLDQKIGDKDQVFFVPEYDRYWYEGIGAMAHAQQIDDPATSILWWETAVAKWAEYVAVASAEDPWIRLAKAHHASCERQLAEAKKRAARSPKPRRSGPR